MGKCKYFKIKRYKEKYVSAWYHTVSFQEEKKEEKE